MSTIKLVPLYGDRSNGRKDERTNVRMRVTRAKGNVVQECEFLFKDTPVSEELFSFFKLKGFDRAKRGSNLVYELKISKKGNLIVVLKNGFFNGRPFNQEAAAYKVYTALWNKFWKTARRFDEFPFHEGEAATFVTIQQSTRDEETDFLKELLTSDDKKEVWKNVRTIRKIFKTNYDAMSDFRESFIEGLNDLHHWVRKERNRQ